MPPRPKGKGETMRCATAQALRPEAVRLEGLSVKKVARLGGRVVLANQVDGVGEARLGTIKEGPERGVRKRQEMMST